MDRIFSMDNTPYRNTHMENVRPLLIMKYKTNRVYTSISKINKLLDISPINSYAVIDRSMLGNGQITQLLLALINPGGSVGTAFA